MNFKFNFFYRRLKVAVSLLAKTVLPVVVGVYSYLRNQKTVVESVRTQLLPTVLAFLANSVSRSLSSVQRGITLPLSLRVIKHESSQPMISYDDDTPEKSVECRVLAGPATREEVIADVIFIHGLHGGLEKTWRQGQWRYDKNRIKEETLQKCVSDGNIQTPRRKISLKRSVSDVPCFLPNKVAKTNESACITHDDEENGREPTLEEVEYSDCWPRDWLPKDCPGVRVIAVNYTTDTLWRPAWIKKRNR